MQLFLCLTLYICTNFINFAVIHLQRSIDANCAVALLFHPFRVLIKHNSILILPVRVLNFDS